MFDSLIIGGGPAGLSACLNLQIRNKSFKFFSGIEKTTGLMKAPQIDNYLGLQGISGTQLLDSFKSHVSEMGIEIFKDKVTNIIDMGDYFAVNSNNEFYEAKTIIIGTGHAKANYFPGEKEYLGKGVGYCATCDGPLYKNRPIAIISENEEGEEESIFLSQICSEVFYIPLYKSEMKLDSKIKLIKDKPMEIVGDGNKVVSLKLKDQEIKTDAVFIIRNVIPVSQLLEGLELEDGSIKVNRHMETSINGVFACGDCTGKPYQVSKAVGEGSIAALSAVKFLDKLARK